MEDEWDWLYRECGRLVADKRKQLGLTQVELARKLSMSRASVANMEAGKQRMQLHLLFRLSELLDSSPYDLIPSLASARSGGMPSPAALRMSDEMLIRHLLENELVSSG